MLLISLEKNPLNPIIIVFQRLKILRMFSILCIGKKVLFPKKLQKVCANLCPNLLAKQEP